MGDMSEDNKRYEEAKSFVSGLGAGREAFHSEVTEFCLRIGERSSEDFMRHFTSSHIMRALTSRPMERARIVSQSTGVNEKVALKMSPEASGEALQIALEEKVTTPADVVRLFQPDDRQRYLDRKALWAFDVEGEPFKVTASNRQSFERAKAYIAYIVERGLANLLLSHAELLAAITVEKLAALLPREELGAIIASSLRQPEKYTEENLIAAVPPRTLVDHLPLDYVWSRVVSPLIAERHDYAARIGGRSELPASEDNASWSLTPSPETSSLNIDAYAGDADVVTADDIIEEDSLESGESGGKSSKKSGSESRKSARSA
ncbi:MAG TPA: hypothetical protein VG937_21535 [Polyangiaceae bacterium]|nr:hypothetical protein [Polyangiaceae bacterium]